MEQVEIMAKGFLYDVAPRRWHKLSTIDVINLSRKLSQFLLLVSIKFS